MIDDEAAARRLANAILADLALYNDARIRSATNVRIALAREIGEARDLFHAKVTPELHAIFESALDTRLGGAFASFGARPVAPEEPDHIDRETLGDPERDTAGPMRLLILSVVVMVAGLSLVWWMSTRAG